MWPRHRSLCVPFMFVPFIHKKGYGRGIFLYDKGGVDDGTLLLHLITLCSITRDTFFFDLKNQNKHYFYHMVFMFSGYLVTILYEDLHLVCFVMCYACVFYLEFRHIVMALTGVGLEKLTHGNY